MDAPRFDFGRIPLYISDADVGPYDFTGEHYVDTELRRAPPLLSAREGGPVPWTREWSKRETLETPGGEVSFSACRWTRAGERAELWEAEVADGATGTDLDFLFAYQGPGGYLAVYCLLGHPGVRTPGFMWSNSDGSSSGVRLPRDDAEAMIAAAVSAAREYIERQLH